MNLPPKFAWIDKEEGPRILLEMRKLYGTMETPGAASNPLILSWAKAIGFGNVYKNDAIAWCGLTVAFAAAKAGWDYAPRGNPLYARNWLAWGQAVKSGEEALGDVLVFSRGPNQGHVAIYVGEDDKNYYILGGNQNDAVGIKSKPKNLLIAARRCAWRVDQPASVRKIQIAPGGSTSTKEA